MRMKYPPLNQEEREFAAEHLDILWKFLNHYHLRADDWYDIVVLRYLRSVQRWFQELELHYYSFSTLAFAAMKSAWSTELRVREHRIKTVSLEKVLEGSDGDLSLMDTITTDNLDYIPYTSIWVGGE